MGRSLYHVARPASRASVCSRRAPGRARAGSVASLFALGGGSHVLWLDPDHDLVMVARWVDKPEVDGLLARILASLAG